MEVQSHWRKQVKELGLAEYCTEHSVPRFSLPRDSGTVELIPLYRHDRKRYGTEYFPLSLRYLPCSDADGVQFRPADETFGHSTNSMDSL